MRFAARAPTRPSKVRNLATISIGARVPPPIELYYLLIAALSGSGSGSEMHDGSKSSRADPTNRRIVEVIRAGQ
jgi:hypothetical protein